MVKKASIVRLPPKSNLEILLARSAQASLVLLGLIGFIYALAAAEYILAPVTLGVVIGLMVGPVANKLEAHGLAPAFSASIVLLLFILTACLFLLALATPLSFWLDRLPLIWADLKLQLSEIKEPFEALNGMRDQLRELTGNEDVTVSVDEGMGVESVATLAPAFIGQILLFFASLYFFVATRHQTRTAILTLCFNRRLRWRVAHIFRDVEELVSRYLLSISIINVLEGAAVGVGLYLIGVPSAILWGSLAALTNFVVFIGPAVMVVVLLIVGLAEFDTLGGSLLPVVVYLCINLIEAQFVTPMVIGRTLAMNPFIVLLALVFWIWLWGPLGGFIAIPALLVVYAVIRNTVPGVNWGIDHSD
ncbi:MAG: AI-2E family transporter [Pseudaminobacter sp.]|nr:AI-2E family transporter [Pseudaminobacter sp.]